MTKSQQPRKPRKLRSLKVADLKPPPGRPVDEKRVNDLAESMNRIGQLNPINVVRSPKGLFIRLGLHRWLAARKLGWSEIEGVIDSRENGPEGIAISEEKVISENLIRQHMTSSERADEIARLVKVRAAQMGTPPQGSTEKVETKKPGTAVPGFRKEGSRGPAPSTTRKAIRDVAAERGLTEAAVKKVVQRSEKKAAQHDEASHKGTTPAAEVVRDERGQEIPARLVARWGLHRESIAKIGNLFRSIQTELGKLKEDAGDSWTQPMSRAREVWGSIRTRVPFAVCAWCKGNDPKCKSCHGWGFQTEQDQKTTPKELLA